MVVLAIKCLWWGLLLGFLLYPIYKDMKTFGHGDYPDFEKFIRYVVCWVIVGVMLIHKAVELFMEWVAG